MAVLSVLTGGAMGFCSAIVGLVVLNISWLAAIGLWTGVGTLAACVVLGISMVPRKSVPQQIATPLIADHA